MLAVATGDDTHKTQGANVKIERRAFLMHLILAQGRAIERIWGHTQARRLRFCAIESHFLRWPGVWANGNYEGAGINRLEEQ